MTKLRRLATSLLATAGIATAVFAGSSPAHAAAPADLDVTSCTVFDDPVDYNDGIDWYKIRYTFTNEGGTPTPYGWNARTNFVWKTWGQNEVSVDETQGVLSPGQSATREYWLTKHIVDQRTWGIFLDTGGIVTESQENDNHCTFWVNNT